MKIGTYVVTGAGGFVGSAICRALLAAGCTVRGVARGSYPELERQGVQMTRLDLSNSPRELAALFTGAEGVFHVAAKVEMWGEYNEFFRANVLGTRAVIEACRTAGVSKLVFTSSPSVIADGSNLCGVDESYPYPATHMAAYPATKAIAEREVLAANETGRLYTLSLRPHLIFGPGDNHFVPTIVARARSGRLPVIGAGKNLTDLTFIEDCTRAHLLALDALDMNPESRGRAFFVTQGEPIPMWSWIGEVLERSSVPAVSRSVPLLLAKGVAVLSELIAKFGLVREPRLTRFLVSQMSTDHYFSIKAAQRELSFHPRYSMREAMNLTFGAPNMPEAGL